MADSFGFVSQEKVFPSLVDNTRREKKTGLLVAGLGDSKTKAAKNEDTWNKIYSYRN